MKYEELKDEIKAAMKAHDNVRRDILRQVHGGACHGFMAVLGPDYNAAHRNHFHLDRGPYRVCR